WPRRRGAPVAELNDVPDAAVRAEVDPATSLDGDEPAVILPDAGDGIRWIDPAHARAGDPPAAVILGPAATDLEGRTVREIVVDGWRFIVRTQPERAARLREWAARGREAAGHTGPTEVRAIIPGRVVALSVAVGDA